MRPRLTINDGLSLRHIAWPSNLDVSARNDDSVHLFQSQLSRFRHLVLDKGKALVLLSDGVPAHGNASNRTKRQKCLFDRILFDLKVDATHIHPAHENDGLVPLEGFGLLLLMSQGLLHQDHLDGLLHGVLFGLLHRLLLLRGQLWKWSPQEAG